MNTFIPIKHIVVSVIAFLMLNSLVILPFHSFAQTAAVGSLGGEMCVSPLGTASYSIPIEVIPGARGMQPNLSITYNSAMGRGLLGMGWDLAGLSSITRIPRTNFYDEAIGHVNFDGNDRFAMDGSRLIKLSSGSYATTNAVYGTETENFTRVTLKGTPNDDSQYFVAVTDQGQIVEYGNTSDSKQKLSGKTFGWWANKITDADGNYMNFQYTCTVGEITPTQISYTGNAAAGLGTYAKVTFQYITDPCLNSLWVGGHSITVSRLLSSITVCYGSDTIRSYCFEYDHDRSSRLTGIVLKDGTGTELTRTDVKWGDDLSLVSPQAISGLQGYNIYPGDFTGDNIEDLFLYEYDPNTTTTTWQVKKGDGEGGYTTTTLSGTLSGYANPDRVSVADFNGNGLDDIGCVLHVLGTNNYSYQKILFTGAGFSTSNPETNQTGLFFPGNFKGLGQIQVLTETSHQGNYITLDLENENISLTVPSTGYIRVTDLNGNGKSELFVKYGNYIDVYEYDEATRSFVKIVDEHWMSYSPDMDAFGDFNGDGMQDYVFVIGTQTYMKISKGNDYTPAYHMEAYDGISSQSKMLVGDLNGDSKDDIVRLVYNSTYNLTLKVFYTRDYHDTIVSSQVVQLQNNLVSNNTPNMYHFTDLNRDGKNELFYTGSIYDNPVVINFPERREHDFITSVTNGLGMTTSLEYSFYNTPGFSFLGVDGKRIHYPLVNKMTRPDGIGGDTETAYSYGEAIFDYARTQFLGFRYHKTRCNGTNTKLEFEYNSTYHYLNLVHTLVYYRQSSRDDPSGYIPDNTYWNQNQGFSHYEIVNTPGFHDLSYGRFVPYFSITSTINQLENIVTTCYSWLNAEGRVSKSSIHHRKAKTENSVIPWISRDSTEYTFTTVTLPNGKTAVKPSTVQTWNIRNGFTQMPWRKNSYAYSSGRLARDTVTDSDGPVGVTSYTYNSVGWPVTETYKPNGLNERTKTYGYDHRGRFLTQVTDVLGHTQSATFNKYTGTKTTETDVNNLTTTYQYDDFGRLVTVTRPDQTVHHISYHWYNGNHFGNAVFYRMETETGTPERRTYYDILGRAIHTYSEDQGYHDMVYDARGRMVKTTFIPYAAPSVSSSYKTWHNYEYDDFDRIVAEDCPYTDLSYSYYDATDASQHDYYVSVVDNIRDVQQTKAYDALGRPLYAKDEGGTISYSYAYETVSGMIRDKVTVSLGSVSTVVVSDIRGNRLSIQDPDAGTVTSTYNALNQLISRTDANGNQTSYNYDLAGRTIRTVYSDGADSEVLLFTYDNASGKGIGKLASVQNDTDTEYEYAYDNLGRLATYTVYDGHDYYEHLYEYDNLGRLQYLTYPDGFRIKHYYTIFGELSSIYDASDNSRIFEVFARNDLRQPTTCVFGNGTGTQYTYNAYGMVTGIRNGNSILGNNVQSGGSGEQPVYNYIIEGQYRNLYYTYDNRGFIETKRDTLTGQSEAYGYDDLDRLESYKVNGITAGTFTYGNNGNIEENTRIGRYNYSSSKPHAVTAIDSDPRIATPPSLCEVTYNMRNRPDTIQSSGYRIVLDYDASTMRRHTTITNGQTLVKQKTRISDLYEQETASNSSRRLDYIYFDGQVVAVHVDENSTEKFYYVLTDHLGSWEKVLDENKNTVQQTHFDPWGNRMSYTAWNTPQTQTSFTLDRGFTGHEHYDCIHVINANARLYDPVIGRFFSPDPFVQAPDFTQNYNRYSYCMNNPVMFSDPDGEYFIVDSWIIGFVSKFFETGSLKQSWNEANKRAGNDAKLWGGWFATDSNKGFWGQAGEIFSRFTWQLPQTLIGWLVAESCNTLGLAGGVESVDYKYGATVTRTNNEGWGAVTLGSYITGSNSIRADENNSLFQHEYGHYLQSQEMGLAYLPRVGIPSLLSSHNHNFHPVEQDANRRAFLYFNQYISGFYKSKEEMFYDHGWDFIQNPLNVYKTNMYGQYVDYRNESSLQLLDKLSLHAKWYDYPCWLIFPIGPIAIGLFNSVDYNLSY